ncbi:MAG: desulfoferrodoxin Dfx [Erysipelotrichaceae bacterium]|nr:desulfoferrodoxin Dfx [Erysipelotrichaceae bacterium]
MKYYICETCGNIIEKINDSGVPVVCCGKPMKELIAGTVDASREKHIPVYSVEGNKVSVVVGSVEHPMVDVHYIQWIVLKTNKGIQRKHLSPNEAPRAEFTLLEGEVVEEVYEYCNLHGLWKA